MKSPPGPMHAACLPLSTWHTDSLCEVHMQAYRDWGVDLFDWQSQSSMLADDTGLAATTRRMMPTVGELGPPSWPLASAAGAPAGAARGWNA